MDLLVDLLVLLVDCLLDGVKHLNHLILTLVSVLLRVGEHDHFELSKFRKVVQENEELIVEVSFVLLSNLVLGLDDSFIGGCDNCNQEVKHNYNHEESLCVPSDP